MNFYDAVVHLKLIVRPDGSAVKKACKTIPADVASLPMSPLQAWREKAKLTLEQVAVAAQVSRQTVDNWERGRSTPRTEHVQRMALLAPGLLTALGLK
jgi:DNA-binding transcriptional regulator YiaG